MNFISHCHKIPGEGIYLSHFYPGPAYLQSSLAQLGIPLTDVLKVLVAVLLLGNILFYEAKNQELQMQGAEGEVVVYVNTADTGLSVYCADMRAVSSLLGVQPLLLQRGLTLRTYRSSRGQPVHSPCSAAAVSDTTV